MKCIIILDRIEVFPLEQIPISTAGIRFPTDTPVFLFSWDQTDIFEIVYIVWLKTKYFMLSGIKFYLPSV